MNEHITVRKHVLRLLGPVVFCALTWPSVASAQSDPMPADLTKASVETLLNVEITSASKHEQSIRDTAAAVFVLTHDDIRRSGATTLPDALRLVPGLHVARIDSHRWAISARGFNWVYANKLLVMIDGRSMYSPFSSGVDWDVEDTMLEDIDRIEVIRGPGATLWGANAVNGIVNIITKRASRTVGGLTTYPWVPTAARPALRGGAASQDPRRIASSSRASKPPHHSGRRGARRRK